jgi:GT2 family glycosyltransferase
MYYGNEKAAIVGPDIITKNGSHQNPYKKTPFTKMRVLSLKFCYHFLYRIFYNSKVLFQLLAFFRKIKNRVKSKNSSTSEKLYTSDIETYALHGSCLFFTEKFFEHYHGFDEGTFLYMEEFILAKMVQNRSLKMIFNPHVKILHFEDGSSKVAFGNKEYQIFRFSYESTRYMLKKYYSTML